MKMCMCSELHALETGDFDELREMMGDEYVEEMLIPLDMDVGQDDYYAYEGEYDCCG
jgi:hypothetical protein